MVIVDLPVITNCLLWVKNRAFTVVELMITTAVAAIFFALVLSNMFKGKQNYEFKAYLREVRTILELARQKSISLEIPSSCTYDSFEGYGVQIDLTSPQLLDLVYFCSGTSASFREFNLSQYARVNFITNNIDFYFKKGLGETNMTAGTSVEIWMQHSLLDSDQCAYLNINNFGIITLNEKQTCP